MNDDPNVWLFIRYSFCSVVNIILYISGESPKNDAVVYADSPPPQIQEFHHFMLILIYFILILIVWCRWERYIFLYYIPTMLIVITSWTFFLLPSTSYPSRLASTVLNFYRNIMLWLWSFHAPEKVLSSQVHILSPNNVVFPLLPSWSKEM